MFITSDNYIKIGEFGLSKILANYNYVPLQIHVKEYFSKKGDVLSLGYILYQMTNKKKPLKDDEQVTFESVNLKYSKLLRDLIESMLSDQFKRPSLIQILEMKFVKEHYMQFYRFKVKLKIFKLIKLRLQ
jgi:serine/threonine protein kinase